jgi:5-methylthioadenosine/S-adenosylhomocysteine deaminase
MSVNDIKIFSALSMVEALRCGTTLLNDMYFETDAILEAADFTGIDVIESITLMDIDGNGKKRLENFVDFCKKYPKTKKSVCIHGFYTASKKYVQECIETADKMNVDLFHIHFCENADEVKTIKSKQNVKNPSDVLVECFDVTKHKIILAHCVKLTNTDMLNIKKLGASISHNPVSNLRLGCGIANVKKMREHGITVGIGTDGQGSCSKLSVLENAKFASLLQKGVNEDPTLLTAYEVLQMATIDGAKALHLEKEKGSISVGKDADLVI